MTAEFLAGFVLAVFLAGIAWRIKTKRDERKAREMPETWSPPTPKSDRVKDYEDRRQIP